MGNQKAFAGGAPERGPARVPVLPRGREEVVGWGDPSAAGFGAPRVALGWTDAAAEASPGAFPPLLPAQGSVPTEVLPWGWRWWLHPGRSPPWGGRWGGDGGGASSTTGLAERHRLPTGTCLAGSCRALPGGLSAFRSLLRWVGGWERGSARGPAGAPSRCSAPGGCWGWSCQDCIGITLGVTQVLPSPDSSRTGRHWGACSSHNFAPAACSGAGALGGGPRAARSGDALHRPVLAARCVLRCGDCSVPAAPLHSRSPRRRAALLEQGVLGAPGAPGTVPLALLAAQLPSRGLACPRKALRRCWVAGAALPGRCRDHQGSRRFLSSEHLLFHQQRIKQ